MGDLAVFALITDNATVYSTGRAAASLTSTTMNVEVKNERALFDEEECKPIHDRANYRHV